jgi:hypothetical protein
LRRVSEQPPQLNYNRIKYGGIYVMKIIKVPGWIVYFEKDTKNLDKHKCGKWMHFFNDMKFASDICKRAVETGVVSEAKHSDVREGVCCFYLNCDDLEAHKRTINYFLENNLIRKTKKGKLYNISFKLDDQTRAGEYGDSFHSEIKLEQFIDLDTGKWK